MYHSFSEEELRSFCRKNLENLEIWTRQLIHEQMCGEYGSDYFDCKNADGNSMIKTSIVKAVKERNQKEPKRFQRLIDALFFEDIIYFLCNRNWYDKLFKEIFSSHFPLGSEQLRHILNVLLPIRNSLSHANPISVRQAEMVICYAHDIIDCIKEHYKKMNKEQVWNVPHVFRISDSKGVVYENISNENNVNVCQTNHSFSVGDTYSLTIDVDPSFASEEYDIEWIWKNKKMPEWMNKRKITLTFSTTDIGMSNYLTLTITSHKEWHKFSGHDHRVMFPIRVLPPRQ